MAAEKGRRSERAAPRPGQFEEGGGLDRALEVVGSLRRRLQPRRNFAGEDGVAASVKRKTAEKAAEKTSRKAVMVEYIAPAPPAPGTATERGTQRRPTTVRGGKKSKPPTGACGGRTSEASRGEVPAAKRAKSAAAVNHTAAESGQGMIGFGGEGRESAGAAAAAGKLERERLVALAAAAARAASGRAANQLRASLLALLRDRPLTFATTHAAVGAGLAAANLPVPPRAAVEDAVKRVATYRAPGRYHLVEELSAEADELLRGAIANVTCESGQGAGGHLSGSGSTGLKVLTPPLRAVEPTTSAHAHRGMLRDINGHGQSREGGVAAEEDAEELGKDEDDAHEPVLTDKEDGRRHQHGDIEARCVAAAAATVTTTATATAVEVTAATMFDGGVPARAAGDIDDAWMHLATARGVDGPRHITSDAEFYRLREAFAARHVVYMGMYRALEANALEFRALVERRDKAARGEGEDVTNVAAAGAVAALSRRMAEFRVVRRVRYGAMARVFDELESELSDIKRRCNEYADAVEGR